MTWLILQFEQVDHSL